MPWQLGYVFVATPLGTSGALAAYGYTAGDSKVALAGTVGVLAALALGLMPVWR